MAEMDWVCTHILKTVDGNWAGKIVFLIFRICVNKDILSTCIRFINNEIYYLPVLDSYKIRYIIYLYCFSLKTDCGRIRPRFKVGLLIFPIVFRPFPRPKLSLELQQNRTTLLLSCETEFELQKKMRDFLKICVTFF